MLAHTKISKREMINLNGLVLEDKEVTGVLCKNRLGLRASARTVQKYLRRLGWKKRSSKFLKKYFFSIHDRL